MLRSTSRSVRKEVMEGTWLVSGESARVGSEEFTADLLERLEALNEPRVLSELGNV